MTRHLAALIVAGASLPSLPVHAHQPTSEVYDQERTVVLEGDVASFLFGTPHHPTSEVYDQERTVVLEGDVASFLFGTPHHPTSEVYDQERTVVLEGDVTSLLFGNPHSMVHLRVADRNGELHTWAVEWRAASRLRRMGWTAGALSVGDRVKMCGNPGRDPGVYRLYLLNLTRILPGAPPDAEDDLCEPAPTTTGSTGSDDRPGSPRTTRR